MRFQAEQARTQSLTPEQALRAVFGDASGPEDAVFLSGDRRAVLGFRGLPFAAPVCAHLLGDPVAGPWLRAGGDSQLLTAQGGRVGCRTAAGEQVLPPAVEEAVRAVYDRVVRSPGELNEKGELLLDLKTYPVGPHYPVNLLLGDRAGYPEPLYTTPKSAVDSLGRGSFRASGGQQVLATRFVLQVEENGEPANRQFYLTENGKQIFYSANVRENVRSARCVHSQNRTVITYETECGLGITRTIFLLPQEEEMPTAVEAQRVRIENRSGRSRALRIVFTGMFGITDPGTLASDIVYANVVAESEVYYREGRPAALTLHHQPKECAGEKRFAALLCRGGGLDEFCVNLSDFIGSGSLEHPELAGWLPSVYNRKMAPFFAMAKSFSLGEGESIAVDEYVGMLETEGDVRGPFDAALDRLLSKYADPAALEKTLTGMVGFWERYAGCLVPDTGDRRFDAYVSRNLPFQTLYQTYVSRAFAWTQKSYRETGFREIQDIFASMVHLHAMGEDRLVRELIGSWIKNVFPMGYAYHNFTFRGKEPGDCSDDALWLAQAVRRYVELTGDYAFLRQEFPMAGTTERRTLWDTLQAILTYSGRISIGAHGMPLLDKADWNDTLRLDRDVLQGPEKEARYRTQLRERGQAYGVPWENTQSESVMNACLLILAADAAAALAPGIGKEADGAAAAALAARVRTSMQEYAWKGDFFARCLLNDGRGYDYLGAGGDGLALEPGASGTYFLNSFSWPILADAATEEQIAVMLDVVERRLKTEAGLKLCTLVDFDRLGIQTGTQLYFPGDRENGGVFKHAAMMAAAAALKAAKEVADEGLAARLRDLTYFMVDRTVPYCTLDDPFVRKGNPRFCTQYNNSETGENIGPMLSGTASWLSLVVRAFLGAEVCGGVLTVAPVLRRDQARSAYTLRLNGTDLRVEIEGAGRFRAGPDTAYALDGVPCGGQIPLPADGGSHIVTVRL